MKYLIILIVLPILLLITVKDLISDLLHNDISLLKGFKDRYTTDNFY